MPGRGRRPVVPVRRSRPGLAGPGTQRPRVRRPAGAFGMFDPESSLNPAALGRATAPHGGFTSCRTSGTWRTRPGTASTPRDPLPATSSVGGPIAATRLSLGLSYSSYTSRDFTLATCRHHHPARGAGAGERHLLVAGRPQRSPASPARTGSGEPGSSAAPFTSSPVPTGCESGARFRGHDLSVATQTPNSPMRVRVSARRDPAISDRRFSMAAAVRSDGHAQRRPRLDPGIDRWTCRTPSALGLAMATPLPS